jgi:hypothetical protein
MGGTCSGNGKMRNEYKTLVGKHEGNRALEDTGAYGRIILKLNLKKNDAGTNWIQLPKIRLMAGSSEKGNVPPEYIKFGIT